MDTDVRTWIGERGWEVALVAAAGGILAAHVFGRVVADPDLWGHVLFGQLVLAEGLPELDPYAYTSGDHPWINHEILSEIAVGWAYGTLGSTGLHLVRYALVGAVVVLVWRELARGGLGAVGAALGTALVLTAMSAGVPTVRPHLFTYLFFLLVLLCLARAGPSETRWMWLVPPILALWINVHGGVLAGLGVVGLWWAGEGATALAGRRRDAVPFGRATLVLAASALALLVNPYGWELPLFLADTATEARPIITEWQPVTAFPLSFAFWTLLTGLGLTLLLRVRPRLRPSHGFVLAALAFLPLLASRHLPLYALAWGVLLVPHTPDVTGWLRRRWRRGPRDAPRLALWTALVAVGVLAGASGAVIALERGSFACVPLPTEEQNDVPPLPVEAVGVLERSGVSGNLATPFNWGEYTIWRVGPRIQVGMDGRRETVYPDSVYEDFRDFRAGVGDWERWLERYGADMALVVAGSAPDNLLALTAGWREVHRDGLAAVYGRDGWPGTSRVGEASREAGGTAAAERCFPAGGRAGHDGSGGGRAATAPAAGAGARGAAAGGPGGADSRGPAVAGEPGDPGGLRRGGGHAR